MSLTLIIGSAKSGKTAAAIAKILDAGPLEAASSVRFVVPTPAAVRRVEAKIIERTGRPGILGNVVTTFYDLAEEILAAKSLTGKLISDIQKELMLRKLVESAAPGYLKESAEFPGFIKALDQIIGELKISLVKPEDMAAAAGALPTPESREKISELTELYRRYQEEILRANNLHDREGLMWLALEIVQTEIPFKQVIFDGFDRMNNVEKAFLEALVAKVPETTATLTYEFDRPDIFESIEPIRKFMLDLGATEKHLPGPEEDNTGLAYLKKNMFRPGARPKSADTTVTIIEGCDRAMEIELAALEIRKLIAESHFALTDIALTTRDIESYREPVNRIFSKHGVPVAEGKRPLGETAPARLVCCCLNIIRRGWPRDEVTRLLKSEMIGERMTTACRVEVRAKKLGVGNGRRKWLGAWGENDRTHRFRLAVLKPVADFEDSLRQAQSITEQAEAVRELIGGFKWRSSEDRLLFQDSAATKALRAVLDDLEASAGLPGEAGSDFPAALEQSIALSSYKPAGVADSVCLLPVAGLSGGRFKAVFILGLLEKSWPRRVWEEPFLHDRERAALNRRLDHQLSLRLPEADFERYLFYLAVGSAEEKLYLSYPLTDSSAKDSLPSFYLAELNKLLTEVPRRRRDHTQLVPSVEAAPSRTSLKQAVVYGLARFAPEIAGATASAYNSFNQAERVALAGILTDNHIGKADIGDPKILKWFDNPDKIYTCTELEAYANCPFRHFCSYTLRLDAIREEVDQLDTGSLLHAVLCRLFRESATELKDNFHVRQLDPAATISRAFEILLEEFAAGARMANMPKHEAATALHDLKMILRHYLTSEIKKGWDGFVPSRFELEFGIPAKKGRDRDPFSTETRLIVEEGEGRPAAVRGKIDRVDLRHEKALVIDYKLGSSTKITDFHKGLTLQAMIYALALKKLFNLEPVGMEYRPLKTWKPDGYYLEGAGINKKNRVLDSEQFSDLLRRCEAFVVDIAERLRSGRIEVDPLNCKSYCPFTDICRFDKYAAESSKN